MLKKNGLSCWYIFLIIILSYISADAQKQPESPVGSLSAHTGLLLTDEATLNLIHNSSGDLAHDYVSRIALWDRSQMTEGYRLAAEWVADKAREFGLEEVQIESYPSGGSTRYFGNTTERMKKLKSISFM